MKLAKTIMFTWILGLMSMPYTANAQHNVNTPNQQEITQTISHYGFEETLSRLKKAIQAKGLTLFAAIDHAEAAHKLGLTLSPKTVLIFGSPLAGTPIMQAHPSVALDLPFRVLVAETSDHQTVVSYHPASQLTIHHLSDKQIKALSQLGMLVDNTVTSDR